MPAPHRFALPLLAAVGLGLTTAARMPAQAPPAEGVVEEELGEEQSPEPPGTPAGAEREAEQAYADGDLPRAMALYRALAQGAAEPAVRARLLLTAAWLGFQLGDATAARADLEQALFEDPAVPFRADLFSPEFAALHQDAQRDAALRRQREGADRLNRAVEEIGAGRYAAARALLEEGLRLAPDDPDGLYNLALVDLRTGRADQALAGFERVLALERGRPEALSRELKAQALNNAAVIYFDKQQFADAETALAEAVKLDADDARSWFNLGLTRQKLGRAPEALAAFRRARDLDPRDVDVARQLGLAHIERAEWVEAVAILLEATREQPETADLWTHLGRAQRGLGNLDGALQSFERAIALDPDNRHADAEPAALLAAETWLQRKDTAGAIAAAEKAALWRPDKGDGWMLLGLARLAAGDARGAREALERAAAVAPQRPDVAHNLGTAYLTERDLERAASAFRRALELDPGAADTARILAQIEAQLALPAATPESKRPPRSLGADLKAVDLPQLGLRGLAVEQVAPGGAADRAGLAVGDLVLRADDRTVESPERLLDYVTGAGRAVRLEVLRQGRSLTLAIRID